MAQRYEAKKQKNILGNVLGWYREIWEFAGINNGESWRQRSTKSFYETWRSLGFVKNTTFFYSISLSDMGIAGGSDGKESTCSAGDPDWIPGLGTSPGEGNR